MLKHLDIQISGFDKILPPEEKIITDLKSSISENVKTKYRAAAAVGKAITTTSNSSTMKPTEDTSSASKASDVHKDKDAKEKDKEPSLNSAVETNDGKIKQPQQKKKTKANKPVIKKVKTITASAILVKKHKSVKTVKKLVVPHKNNKDVEKPQKKEVTKKDKEEEKVKEKEKEKDAGETGKDKAPKKVATRKVLPSPVTSVKQQNVATKRSRSAIADMLTTPSPVAKKVSSQKRTPTPRSKSLEVSKKSKICEEKNSEDPPAKEEPPDKKDKLPPEKDIPIVEETVPPKIVEEEKQIEKIAEEKIIKAETKDNKEIEKKPQKDKDIIQKEDKKDCNEKMENIVVLEVSKDVEKKETAPPEGPIKKKPIKKKEPSIPKATLRKYNLVPKQLLKKLHKKVLPKPIEKTKKPLEDEPPKKKDVYDFKSGSESDEEIKMELPTLKILKEYSDEDDKPLGLLTKDKPTVSENPSEVIESPKVEPQKVDKVEEKEKPKPPKKDKKSDEKSTVSPKKETKPPAKKPPKKEKIIISSSEIESSSSEEEIYLGPKRHRMASLNASAKVQCLYENESRTAQELGLSRTIVHHLPKVQTIPGAEAETAKVIEKPIVPVKKESSDEKDSSDVEIADMKRELRNAPGLRGAGKLGNSMTCPVLRVPMTLMKKAQKNEKDALAKKAVEKPKKILEKKVKLVKPKEAKIDPRKRLPLKKRKRPKKEDSSNESGVILGKKRIASLNASAIVAATYEVERHLDRNLATDCSSYESLVEEVKKDSIKNQDNLHQQNSPKKIKQEKDIKTEIKEELKDVSRPTSTSVVIVQDTDVTITGMYVNTATGSSQESYCKMQYRVTEERVVRPSSSEPPKSYTPLSALSNSAHPWKQLEID
uniref:Uncharacterized protein n=1 Tax=Megaselia scalaris TaxID=36166 RepID=T1GVP0_MEGSC